VERITKLLNKYESKFQVVANHLLLWALYESHYLSN